MNSGQVCARLQAESPSERVVAIAKMAAIQSGGPGGCPAYVAALRIALSESPPLYGNGAYGRLYHGAAENGQWLAVSLITNAEREGDGATRLWSLAACSGDDRESGLIKRHAVDESCHALSYLSILNRAFPGAVSPSFRKELKRLSPSYSMTQNVAAVPGSPYARVPTVDDFVQMNIAEVRTTIHHLMQREAIAKHCPPENMPTVIKVLDRLLADEIRHVAYTAALIEEKAREMDPVALQELFCRRVADFNRITSDELGQSELVFD